MESEQKNPKFKLAKYAIDLRSYRLPNITAKGNRHGWKHLYPSFEDAVKAMGLDPLECVPYRKNDKRNLIYKKLTDDQLAEIFPDEFSWRPEDESY